jgi:hypothetical protein
MTSDPNLIDSTIDADGSVTAGRQYALAAAQFNTATMGRDYAGCTRIISGREVGQMFPADLCKGRAEFRIDFLNYRCGFETQGVFSPGETINARVCAACREAAEQMPGFLRARRSAPPVIDGTVITRELTAPAEIGPRGVEWPTATATTAIGQGLTATDPAPAVPSGPGHCAICGDPLAWTGEPGSERIHAWTGRVGLPERPYDHLAQPQD